MEQNECSRSSIMGVHVGPEYAIADIIVLVRNTVDEGTSGSVELFMLTKKKNAEKFEFIKQFTIF